MNTLPIGFYEFSERQPLALQRQLWGRLHIPNISPRFIFNNDSFRPAFRSHCPRQSPTTTRLPSLRRSSASKLTVAERPTMQERLLFSLPTWRWPRTVLDRWRSRFSVRWVFRRSGTRRKSILSLTIVFLLLTRRLLISIF